MKNNTCYLLFLLIFLIFICNGCNPEKEEENSEKTLVSTQFIEDDKTEKVLNNKVEKFKEIAELNTGGYINVPPDFQLGSLYSTYYTLKINQILGKDLDRQTKSVLMQAVKDYFDNLPSIQSFTELNDFYYALEISKILNMTNTPTLNYSVSKEIIFNLYNTKDGTFNSVEADGQSEIMKESVTLTSLKIMNLYGERIPKKTISWLTKEIESNQEYLNENIDFIIEALDVLQSDKNYAISSELNKNIIFYLDKKEVENAFDLHRISRASDILDNFEYTKDQSVMKKVKETYIAERGWNAFLNGAPEQLGTYFVLSFIKNFHSDYIDNFSETAHYYNGILGLNGFFVSPISDQIDIHMSFLLLDLDKLSKDEVNEVKITLKKQSRVFSQKEETNRNIYYWNKLVEELGMNVSFQKKYIKVMDSITESDIQSFNNLYYATLGESVSEKELKEIYSQYREHRDQIPFPKALYIFSTLGNEGLLTSTDVNYFIEKFENDIAQFSNEEHVFYLLSQFLKKGQSSVFDKYMEKQKKAFLDTLNNSKEPIDVEEYYYLLKAWDNSKF